MANSLHLYILTPKFTRKHKDFYVLYYEYTKGN